MVQAQRLVRRLCKYCKQGRDLHEDDCHALELEVSKCGQVVEIYDTVGCDLCMNTGYSGRVAIYEIVPITDVLRNAIHDGASLPQLRQLAMQ